MKTRNSNYLSTNGIEIIEGAKVFRTSQDDYKRNGKFLVEKTEGDLIHLINLDGSPVNYNYALPNELFIIV
jgi:hypothetical protein